MADDRPVNDDLAAVVAEMQRRYDDAITTLQARSVRLPTGMVLPTILTVALPDTILLQGQTLLRADQPVLLQWVIDNNRFGDDLGLFGVGDGSTTFRVPDWKGRTLVGATAARPVGTLFGDISKTIQPANMATHTHQVQIANANHAGAEVGSVTRFHGHGTHTHGSHGHESAIPRSDGGSTDVGPRITFGAQVGASGVGNDSPNHEHFLFIPTHSVNETAVGNNVPLNVESPAVATNYLMWT